MNYYSVTDSSSNSVIVDSGWRESNATLFCPVCVKPTCRVLPSTVVLRDLPESHCYITEDYGCRIGLIQRPMYELLADEKIDDLSLSNVLTPGTSQPSDWLAFWAAEVRHIRGGLKHQHKQCGTCGLHVYQASRPHYILIGDGKQRRIYQDGGGGLIVREDVYKRLKPYARKFHLRFEELPVASEPKDGLGWF